MENASKALIIAGAILLSILIVSIGMVVFRNAREAMGGSNLSSEQIEAFNGKFTSWIGDSMSSSDVYNLISAVQTSNQTEKAETTCRYIAVIVNFGTAANYASYNTFYGRLPVGESAWSDGSITVQKSEDTTTVDSKNVVRLPSSTRYKVTVEKYVNGLIAGIKVTNAS